MIQDIMNPSLLLLLRFQYLAPTHRALLQPYPDSYLMGPGPLVDKQVYVVDTLGFGNRTGR